MTEVMTMESESERILRLRREDQIQKEQLSEEMGRNQHRQLMIQNGVLHPSDEAWVEYKKKLGWHKPEEAESGSETGERGTLRGVKVETQSPEGDPESGSTGSSDREEEVREQENVSDVGGRPRVVAIPPLHREPVKKRKVK